MAEFAFVWLSEFLRSTEELDDRIEEHSIWRRPSRRCQHSGIIEAASAAEAWALVKRAYPDAEGYELFEPKEEKS